MIALHSVKSRMRGWGYETWHRVRLRWMLRDVARANPILVYQMGKVGSSSVVRALQQLDLSCPVLHVHTLDADHLQQAIRKQRASASPYLPEHLIASSILVEKLAEGRFPCRVITLTREPVGRAISFVFEDWKKKAPGARLPGGDLDVRAMAEAVTQLLQPGVGHADPGQWFERELHTCMGIDVFAEPYDVERGFSLVHNDGVSALVMRMEDLDRALSDGLTALLQVDASGITLQRANTGRHKWYAEALRAVKESYFLPADLVGEVFGTRYINHFYGREKHRLRQRWTKELEAGNA